MVEAIKDKIKLLVSSGHGFTLVLMFSVLAILFVLFRMKVVELGYKVTEINKSIQKETVSNKDLKAKKAELLSVKRLNQMAMKHGLGQPKQSQILVIP